MADDEQNEDATEEASGGGKGKLIGIVAVVALLAAGAGFAGATFMTPPADDSDEMAEADPDAEDAEESESSDADRVVVALKPFTVNLRGGGGGRMLRLEVQVEIAAKHAEAFELKKPVLRDAVLTLVSDQTYADLEGLDGKTHLRDVLLRRLNAVLDKVRIERVYFTDFVVQ